MLLYMNLMITKNQNPIRDTHTHNRERNPQITLKIVIKLQEKKAKKKKKGTKNSPKNLKTINKMAISTYLSIITLNVDGLNAPVKKDRVTEWYTICIPITRDSLQI